MAQDSWPSPGHNDRAVTDSEYEQLAARFSDDGVYGSPTDASVVTAGTGLTVNIRANVSASVRGHAWTSGSGDTLDIAPNTAGSARTDRVVLRLDRSDWTVRAVVRQGTAGGAAPPLARDPGDTGLWEILLATVTVPAGATSVTVTRSELYVGARVRPTTSGRLNLYPVPGEMAWETDTQRVRLWDGSAWRDVYSDSGSIVVNAALSAWTVGTDSVLEVRNGIANLRLGSFVRAAGNLGSGVVSRLPVLIPSAYRHPTRDQYVGAYIGGAAARCTIYSQGSDKSGQVWLTQAPAVPTGRAVLTFGTSWAVN